ncbi:MAG: pyruvate dehydrogenase complex dihydrolipoamide acetyltransferase [Ferruginibacter sp.]|nr:pyruvate dehydrogenase complex dihydrolipoamide acetyltransferase [Ferruginibacter sp.]
MAEVIRMPLLSDTMTEGKIIAWNKKVGDKVKSDDVLAEVETDKATMEVVGYVDGTLLHIGIEAGKAAKVNSIIAIVGKPGEDIQALLKEEGSNTPSLSQSAPTIMEPKQEVKDTTKSNLPEGAKVIRMPLLSDTMTEGKIISWNKKIGDKVKSDDVLAEVETDKATMEVVGYEEGTLLYIGVEAGHAVKVNGIMAIVGKPGTDVSAYVNAENKQSVQSPSATSTPQTTATHSVKDTPQSPITTQEQVSDNNGRIKASPLAKKIAADRGYNLASIHGSGDGGRIIKRDIDSFQPSVAASVPATKGKSAQLTPTVLGTESHTDIELTQMRKVIARRLSDSKFNAPHFYLTMEINMDNAIKARESMNAVSPVKISFNDMVIKACATSLRLHPDVNSSWMGDFIRQNHHIHIGSAVALPEGLIVPVIKFADQKSLAQIASETKELYQKARDKKLQPQEFSGNTFTISNLGMMDIDEFTAIINPPDSCILAVGRIKETVIKKGLDFDVINTMKVTMSCDHRSVDGAVGASFLQTLKGFLENPITMLV